MESAEFDLCFVADVMFLNSTVSTCAAADNLKSLIPTIGIADLSQFVDFPKPSTSLVGSLPLNLVLGQAWRRLAKSSEVMATARLLGKPALYVNLGGETASYTGRCSV